MNISSRLSENCPDSRYRLEVVAANCGEFVIYASVYWFGTFCISNYIRSFFQKRAAIYIFCSVLRIHVIQIVCTPLCLRCPGCVFTCSILFVPKNNVIVFREVGRVVFFERKKVRGLS